MSVHPMSDLLPIRQWGLPIERFFLCAGPCSAESPEQLLAAAEGLQGCPLTLFRAGIWKPRTHPGSFEGHGIKALSWLRRVKEETGFPVGVEVAEPAHVQACLKHGIDVMWIGARTTPNPFAVQALADNLRGTDRPVLVKNPVSPDLGLWIGAVERLYNAGLRKIGVIHRGFAVAETELYRNPPLWRIPIELKRRFPVIPIICDPSHMCGRADMIFPVAQEALDLLYDGLMVEVHHDPAKALSDARQQLTPEQFKGMLDRLKVTTETSPNQRYQTRMEQLRHEIDHVDERIIDLLRKRMDIVQAMGECKRRNQVSTLQPERWREVMATRLAKGVHKGFSLEFLSQLYEVIHEEAIRWQERPLFRGDE
ncbi:MAG: bifunctional 3-deoxy-7-phosphoheptulonate synthase/chorismate mutase type II [Planctomycetota bacterium]|nr:bifunctional 3-deoxy-7-phosphoheptulonate synthase/chorismate mutase type II [Planctomycetota bacterium]